MMPTTRACARATAVWFWLAPDAQRWVCAAPAAARPACVVCAAWLRRAACAHEGRRRRVCGSCGELAREQLSKHSPIRALGGWHGSKTCVEALSQRNLRVKQRHPDIAEHFTRQTSALGCGPYARQQDEHAQLLRVFHFGDE